MRCSLQRRLSRQGRTRVPVELHQSLGAISPSEDEQMDAEFAQVSAAVSPEQALAVYLAQRVHPFPKDHMPFTYDSMSTTFYVRECYSEYYDTIMNFFTINVRGATITGSPGIGTSVMMVYFFLRYQLEHPDDTIVMVSFEVDGTVAECKVWKAGVSTKDPTKDLSLLEYSFDEDESAIFLLDGPPRIQIRRHRFVVFTSPNEHWRSIARHVTRHQRLVLPVWDAFELVIAVEALGLREKLKRLEVSDFPRLPGERHEDEVLYRYDVFGGVARACLASNSSALECMLCGLREEAKSAANGWRECNHPDLHTQLFHLLPQVDLAYPTRDKVASPFVMQLLQSVSVELRKMERELLTSTVQRELIPGAVYAYQHVRRMHQLLGDGTTIDARSLESPPEPSLSVKIERTTHTKLIKRDFHLQDVSDGGYFQSATTNVESIDGLYLIRDNDEPLDAPWRGLKCLVFLSRVAANSPYFSDPVNAERLCAVLRQLEIEQEHWDAQVALVFVVPSEICNDSSKFKRQRLVGASTLWPSNPISCVARIEAPIVAELQGANINTVEHLSTCPPNAQLTTAAQLSSYAKAKQSFARYEEEHVMESSSALQALKRIPQFVWSIDEMLMLAT